MNMPNQTCGRQSRRLLWLVCVAVVAASAVPGEALAQRRRRRAGASPDAQMEYKAKQMLNRGLELMEMKQEERAIKLISSVPQMFPKAKARFRAHLLLGEHHIRQGEFDRAIKQFRPVKESEEADQQANALYQTGICHYKMNNYDKAFMALRQVTNDYPWSVYANESFYYIGQCHYKLGRWAKAVEALQMVGTSVPPSDQGITIAEAGQRLFVKIYDKDLIVLMTSDQKLTVELSAASGDAEKVTMVALGKGGEYYIGSIPTVPGKAKANDGKLQIIGGDEVTVRYIDENTESGKRHQKILSRTKMVSTAAVGFTDGAYREYTQGAFGDSDCFMRVKDLDRNTTDERDSITVKITTRYKEKKDASDPNAPVVGIGETDEKWMTRDHVTVTLTETALHSGIFVGSIVPKVVTDASGINQGDDVLSTMKEDEIVCEYFDETHMLGPDARDIKARAKMLIGRIQDVRIINRVVDTLELKARKNLIEAKIFLKLGDIFKDVGLTTKASQKADLGLERVEQVISASLKASLDRQIVEEAFSVKWDLLLVQDKLREAIAVCRTLTRLFPDSTLVDRALLKIGVAKSQGERPNEAISIFNAIIRLPKSDLKAEAQYNIAKVQEMEAVRRAHGSEREPDFSHAMLAYKRCADLYPDSPFAGDSLEKIASYYIKTKDYARAVELMERVFQDYPDASFLDKMLIKWVQAAYRMGNLQMAKDKCDVLLSEFPSSKLASKARAFREAVIRKMGS